MELTAFNVNKLFFECLATKEESNYVPVQSLMGGIYLHAGRAKGYEADIRAMLDQLPSEFRLDAGEAGGGWPFTNLCMRLDGRQWCDSQMNMDQLMCLGQAVKLVQVTPPQMWALTFGVPYVVVL